MSYQCDTKLSDASMRRIALSVGLYKEAERESSIFMAEIPDDIWDKISQHTPEKIDDTPHITLAFMPNATQAELVSAEEIAREVLDETDDILVRVVGGSSFDTVQDDGTIPHIAEVESPDLVSFRQKLVKRLNSEIRSDLVDVKIHQDYHPHITLQYVPEDTEIPEVPKVEWNLGTIILSHKAAWKHQLNIE